MTTAAATAAAASRAAAPAGRGPDVVPPPGERGRTTVADRVVAKIAAAAVSEVAHARGAARRLAGMQVGSTERPHVEADVDGGLAMVEVTMGVTYPAPVIEVTAAARAAVVERVADLCGLEVRQVDVHVTVLPPPSTSPRRLR